MRIFGAALVTLTLALAAPAQAAGPKEGQWYVSPMLTFIVGDDDRLVDDDVRGGQIGLGYAFDSNWLLEGIVQYNDFTGFQPADQWGVGVDLIRRFNSASTAWSPYVLAGGGWLRTDPDGMAPRRNGSQFSAAAGVMGQVNDNVALRAEYRLRGDASSPGLTDQLFSLGFTFSFGG
ncbi:MAG: outer membrane beta-barrel protein, partial [Gammaproteobacteria bacterium]|nr:outer membrane beta-barrel protein [Gammaproteobacteria bacterium]